MWNFPNNLQIAVVELLPRMLSQYGTGCLLAEPGKFSSREVVRIVMLMALGLAGKRR